MEIFKDIPGYEGLYQVSNLGRVKSLGNLEDRKEKILKLTQSNRGYLMVGLFKNGVGKGFSIHRLVAQAFIPNPENKPQVNHIDGNKLNNFIDNLEWNTASENVVHRYRILGHKPNRFGKFGKDNPNSKKVYQYDLEGNLVKLWESIIDIERQLGFYATHISRCCRGKRKTAKGFIWKYA